MKKIVTVDGNEACALSAYMFSEICGIYPITPSSPMAEHIDEWSSHTKNIFGDNVKVVEMQSEAGAAGFVHGALQTGVLASTFTASQGLLLMIPNMYKMAGEMLPCVMHVAARSLSTHALSIFGDHQDVYATRQTGFCMIASSNVQDCAYLSALAHLSAIKASLPFMHFFDGFRTSHEIDKINILELDDYKDLIDYDALSNFRKKAMNPNNPNTRGTAMNDDVYFQETEARNKFYDQIPQIVSEYMNSINKLAGTDYKPFNYYGSKKATKVIVAMGSVCNTIKEVIDNLGGRIGLVEVHLYRPFSVKHLIDVLPSSTKKIAVLDRTKEAGSNGEPLYLDVVAALKDSKIKVVGGRYGLSSKDTSPAQIKAVYKMLDRPINNFTIGINDDVTHLSLKEDDYQIKNSKEILIYGYGSDGMVSASKSIIKLIGENTDNYVQGYFQYDSKKSGGVTVSHLRISKNKILSSYYVKVPDILVITKEAYLSNYKMVDKIAKDGIVIINTTRNKDEVLNLMSNHLKKVIHDSNSTVYIVNAYSIALEHGLDNKISMIMEYAIMYITNLIDRNSFKKLLINDINNKFSKKGNDIVSKNINSLDAIENVITSFKIDEDCYADDNKISSDDIYFTIMNREGNDLPVSSFVNYADGIFDADTANLEKRGLAENVPKWLNENCIECNLCSFNCPHGVIRPFLLNQEEYESSPEFIKKRCIKYIGTDYYYTVAISVKDCTGCGLCIKNCPGKRGNKALTFNNINDELKNKEQDTFDYLDKFISFKKDIDKTTLKDICFKKPKFRYCGACAGCGEAGYIRLLTQIFNESLVIANATGCSSIYGSSVPSMPYSIPWASSLFEDNAEFGYGMLMSTNLMRNRIKTIMENNMDNENHELFSKWLENYDNYEITKDVYDNLTENIPDELKSLKDYIVKRSIWCIGGDGWAYDIGFGGLDHVLSSSDNINVLVLDTETYSNTGGQASKSTRVGSIAEFASTGKKTIKKDLARIAISYPNCYVASVSMGYNGMQLIKALKEADKHDGPSLVIAYAPCISHGIKGGLINSLESSKTAVLCGYHPVFRYSPENGFILDYKNPNFDLYEEYLNTQTRYNMLATINPKEAKILLEENRNASFERFKYYKELDSKNKGEEDK